MRVLLAAGGSGGHIFPAVALAKELSKRRIEIIFVASRRRLDKKILQDTPYKKIYLSANPMPYTFGWKVFFFLGKLVVDFFQAFYILMRYRPDIIVGFGGYTAGAILLLGAFLNIRTVVHEQNFVPGRTNKILDRFVDKITISFLGTKRFFKNENTVFTGNPLREESLENRPTLARQKLGLDKNKFTLLVMGGSQGARSLNNLVSKGLGSLPQEEKAKIQIVHITGVRDYKNFKDFYERENITGSVFEFIENINDAYSICDLAISRSGAAAIFELAAFGRPMILIPYPSRRNNQRFNAMFLAKKDAAIYRDEEKLQGDSLGRLIIELVNNPHRRKALSDNAKKLSITDGAKRLTEEILKVVNSK